MDRILLTGGTGFIGSHIAEALTAAGFRVVALVRPAADRALLLRLNAEIRVGDILDPAGLREAMAGCDGVIHAAAMAKDWGRRESFHDVNVRGTLNVVEAGRLAQVPHLIITGSVASYGEEDSRVTKDETHPFNPRYPYFLGRRFPSAMNWYRETKAAATREAIATAERHQLNLTVLEPAWVYGEREFGTGFYTYVVSVKNGLRFAPGSTRNRFHVIYARDLAKAYVLALERRLPAIERIIVGNPSAEPMHRIFGLFCREAGLPVPRPIPKWLTYPVGFALELLFTALRRPQPPLLTRSRVNMFYDSIQYSTAKASQVLGFRCDHSLEDGIRRTVAWYRDNRYL